MKTAVETITPEIAKQLLVGNYCNRSIRKSRIEQLVNDIKAGRWQVTHQGIAIAENGRLLDGQHRLLAVVEANKSIQMSVSRDVVDTTFKVIDTGLARLHYDRIHFVSDVAENKIICTMISSFIKWVKWNKQPSIDEIEVLFLDYSDHWQWIAKKFKENHKAKITISCVGAAIAMFHVKDAIKAEEFLSSLISGHNIGENHPVLALREALINSRIPHNDPSGYWKTVTACRYYERGLKLQRLDAAIDDFVGNKNEREHEKRVHRGIKAAQTTKLSKAV